MIKKVLDTIEAYLDGKYEENEDYPFYLELEKELLFDNYDEMHKENKEVTELLNEEIPDICASVGEIDVEEFKRLLRIEFLKAKELYSK
ncbi:hypothetical protein [Clostridium cadaveris]|uniref:hypothetical protein n=1 Tax=Clostridium cadaveris TaxID=1529 RepID=UPI000C081D55|nr:hypothetical protein [Clostridium cadaveris]